MMPSSWHRLDEIAEREWRLRRAAERHRDIGHLRRRPRRRKR